MAPKIVLSADSTCDLSAELKEQYDVHYTSLHIMLRGEDYIDNVTITNTDIFNAYWEDGSLPQTGALSPLFYHDHFKQFTDEGSEVIHISLGSGISSSYSNACLGAEDLPGVYVINSGSLSNGIGQLVIRAGRMIEEGLPAAQIAENIEELRGHVQSSFILDTMDFLAAGGRCPSIVAQAGRLLQFHPEILVSNEDATMRMGKLYRGSMEKAVSKYISDKLAEYEDDILDDDMFLVTSEPDEELRDMSEKAIRAAHPFDRIHRTLCCCTIGSHCGPGAMGIMFMSKTARN